MADQSVKDSNEQSKLSKSEVSSVPKDLSWVNRDSLIKRFTEESKKRFQNDQLPWSNIMKDTLMRYFRNEFLLLGNYQFKRCFLRLERYDNLDLIRRVFKPLKQVNSSNLTAKYFANSITAYVRATSYDDVHKAIKYGFWGPEEADIPTFKELLQRGSKEDKKVIILLG